jgi:general secretion pathway protein D
VHGFAWEKSGQTYLVAGKEKFVKPAQAQALPQRRTLLWQCKHSKPADLVTVVTKLLPNVTAVEGPNMITPTLESSDSGTSTSMGSSTGSSSSSTTSTSGSSSSQSVRSNSNMLVLMGEPADIEQARSILAQLDVPRRQVNIDVSITEINKTSGKELGTEWAWNEVGLTEDTSTSGIWFGKFSKEATSITATVSALIKNGNATLLAKPNISVLDNEYAEILIGDRILFPKLTGYNDNGIPIYDKDEEKVGIYLQIAPKIAGDSEIVLTVYPQVSLVTGYLNDYPQISTREAKTTVSVKNGATLAIGGLLQDNEINNYSKVPLLGDLPIIGSVFRHSKKTKERTEIVIFLTPKIVEGV